MTKASEHNPGDEPELHRPPAKRFDVFISYSRADRDVAREIAEIATQQRLRVWFDEWCLKPGQNWREEIDRAIEQSKSCLILLGRQSTGSGPWLSKEWSTILRRAWDEPEFHIIAARLTSKAPLPSFLHGLQTWNLSSGTVKEGLDDRMCMDLVDYMRRDSHLVHRPLKEDAVILQRQLDRGRADALLRWIEQSADDNRDE